MEQRWYFAEGYTGGDAEEFLTLANPNSAPAHVQVAYLLGHGQPVQKTYTVAPMARFTQKVNSEVGNGQSVAMVVTSDIGIVAERPMYMTYTLSSGPKVPSGTDVLGANTLAMDFSFGYLDTTKNHDTFLTVLNPHPSAMTATVTYYPAAGGTPKLVAHTIPANARGTITVRRDVPSGSYSARVHLSVAGLVERPMYLKDGVTGYTGAADVVGVPAAQSTWYFAEGLSSGSSFSERYILANPCSSAAACHDTPDAQVTLSYLLGNGKAPVRVTRTIPAGQQVVVNTRETFGATTTENSVVVSASWPILAERVMSFSFLGREGATDVLGASSPSTRSYFAEGSVSQTFAEYLTLENPDPTQAAAVTVAFLPAGGSAPRFASYTVKPSTRFTVDTGRVMSGSFALAVDANRPIVAERPIYFDFANTMRGGSDVLGYPSQALGMPKPTPTPTPTPVPTATRVPQPVFVPPTATAVPCADPCNPWGYNFSPGSLIYSPPSNFCDYFNCIPSFWKYTNGYVEECQDGTYSHSGGRSGSCSGHLGNLRPLYSH